MNKRIFPKSRSAQLFTILTIMIIALMFISFEIFSTVHKRDAIKTRVSSMDSFLDSTEKNLERQMYISGFRIIFLAEDYISNQGIYVPDIDAFFEEAFFNGTVGGVMNNIMLDATYGDLVDAVNERAAKINVVVSMTNSNISVGQDDPWHVKFEMVSNFVMEDRGNLARWNKTQTVSVLIPVDSFQDPIFAHESGGRYFKNIVISPYEGNYVSGSDYSNLIDHANKGYYAAHDDAPSFLDRLEGNFDADENGIESFVNLDFPDFNSNRNSVDHLYFAGNTSGSTVSGMPSWVQLDGEHSTRYGI